MSFLKNILTFVVIFILSIFLFFSFLGKSSLWNEEAWHAECARELVKNDFIPTFNKINYPEKPPFIYWCMNFTYYLFGINEFGARFCSSIFAIGNILLVFWAATYLYSTRIGLWGILILLSTFLSGFYLRLATPIAASTFFLNLCIFSFIFSYEKRKNIYFYVFCIAMAFSVLTEGLIGFILPTCTTLFFLLLNKDLSFLKQIKLRKGILLFLCFILPWYVFVSLKAKTFSPHQLLNLGIYSTPLTFYLTLPLFCFPWIGLLPYLFWNGYKRKTNKHFTSIETFLWLWLAIFFVNFFLTRKPIYYACIALPGLSLLLALYLEEITNWALKTLLYLNACLALVWIFGGGAILAHFQPEISWIAFLGFLPLLSSYFGLKFLKKNQWHKTFLLQLLCGYIVLLLVNNLCIPALESYRAIKPLSIEIKKKITLQTPIASLNCFYPGFVFYTQHYVEKINNIDTLSKKPGQMGFIFLEKENLQILKEKISLKVIKCHKNFLKTLCVVQWSK